jgi:hypothetical protein
MTKQGSSGGPVGLQYVGPYPCFSHYAGRPPEVTLHVQSAPRNNHTECAPRPFIRVESCP